MLKNALLSAVAFLCLSGCTSESDALETLSASGYTEVELTGYAWFVCGRDDMFHTEFTATNPSGQRVSGVVCSGVFKGGTIRF